MSVLLVVAVAAVLVFVGARLVKVRLTPLGYLGAGVLAWAVGVLVFDLLDKPDPVLLKLDRVTIPILSLVIGSALVVLLLKVVRPLR